MTDVATADVGTGKKNHVQKPEKPDQAEFDKNMQKAQEEHDKIREELRIVKGKLDLTKAPGKNSRQQQLKEELANVRSAQSAKKNSKGKLDDQIKTLQTMISNKIKEQQTAKGKMPYRNLEELDLAVERLEQSVERGTLKLVDERKALADISNLKKQRRVFGNFADAEKSIAEDKKKLEELKDQRRDPEVKALSEQYDALQQELNEIKSDQDAAYQNLNALRDERTKLHEKQQEKWQVIQNLKTEYFAAKDAYRAYEQEAWKIRREKKERQDKEYRQEKLRQVAQQKMEEASQPAFTSEIMTCEGLIGYFDPSSAEAARKAKLASEPRALAAQASRSVETKPNEGVKKLATKDEREEDYFAGTGGKKKKGKKGGRAAAAIEGESAAPAEPPAGKFNLPFGVLEELGKVGVEVPGNQGEVPRVLTDLRAKLAKYKEDQEHVTKENIAKAQKEIDRLTAADGETPTEMKKAEEVKEGEEGGKEDEKEVEEEDEKAANGDATSSKVEETSEVEAEKKE